MQIHNLNLCVCVVVVVVVVVVVKAIIALADVCLAIGHPDSSVGFLRNAACQVMENATVQVQGELQLGLAKA